MAHRPSDDDEDDDLDELLGGSSSRSSSPPRSHRRRARPSRSRPAPVRRWRQTEELDELDDEGLDLGEGGKKRSRTPVFWRARDSLYFEPLVALAILAVLLVSLFAYTANWPPVYVIESNSMQHGQGDHVGTLNAGDIVLAQKVGLSSVVTYVQGIQNGFSTYGLSGDVLLYYPNGSSKATPIIHRAIIYLQWDKHNATYNATGLTSSECGNGSGLYVTINSVGTATCATSGLSSTEKLVLYHVGGRTVAVNFGYTNELGDHSGFLTLGDNNSHPDQAPGAVHLSSLVEAGWVIGVARGMIPWFGAVKLLLDGNSGRVPTASWEFMGLTIAGIIFAAAGLHVLLRRARNREEDERDELPEPAARAERPARPVRASASSDGGAPPPPPVRRGPAPVRAWQAPPEPTTAASASSAPAAPRRMTYEQRRRAHFVTPREHRGGRRRRPETQDESSSDDEDDDL